MHAEWNLRVNGGIQMKVMLLAVLAGMTLAGCTTTTPDPEYKAPYWDSDAGWLCRQNSVRASYYELEWDEQKKTVTCHLYNVQLKPDIAHDRAYAAKEKP